MIANEEYLMKLSSVKAGVSLGELERRWKEVREAMTKRGLDVIICEGTFGKLGGYPRWFTDRRISYNTVVAFPIEGEVLFARHGDHVDSKPVDSYGVKDLVRPSVQTLYGNTVAPLIVEALKPKRPAKIGFAGYGTLSTASYLAITKGFPGTEFEDVTDLVDEIKAVKSEEELACIKRTAEMHDMGMRVAVNAAKPGRTANDVINEIINAMTLAGSTEWLVSACALPPGEFGAGTYNGPANRVMRDGWVLGLLMEFNGPEGYYNEMMRIVCIGRAPKELLEVFDDVKEAQSRIAKMLKPGADCNDILRANNKFMKEKNYPEESRLAGHSQGYDLVERPAFSPLGETIKLKAGMVVSLHPTCHGKTYWGIIADDYLVTETGGKRIHENPQEVFVV